MNNALRTYGIVINMDYEHHKHAMCSALWNEISQKMQAESFSFEKRMFVVRTEQDKDVVCNKARKVMEELESHKKESYEKQVFSYVKDFYAVDVTDYDDLTRPYTPNGIEVEEDIVGVEIQLN